MTDRAGDWIPGDRLYESVGVSAARPIFQLLPDFTDWILGPDAASWPTPTRGSDLDRWNESTGVDA